MFLFIVEMKGIKNLAKLKKIMIIIELLIEVKGGKVWKFSKKILFRAPSTYGTVHNVWAVESEQDNGNNASTTLENLPRIEQSEMKRVVTPRLTKRKLLWV